MEDLISRNELYKQIKVYLDTNSLGETSARTELSVGEIASIISDISVVKQQNIESWIPVSERLPEEDGSFLCSFEINDKRWIGIKPYGLTNYQESLQSGITPKYYGLSVRKYFYEPSYNMELENVVAWRPLPKAYME